MGKFQLYRDGRQEYRWRLRARNNRIIADSGEGYVHKADCEHGIELLRQWAGEVEIYQDKGGGHRWRMRVANKNIFADSGEAYARKSGVMRALGRVQLVARDAVLDDQSVLTK
jgi:uncharacterized protein YegP (UPF0339 family)